MSNQRGTATSVHWVHASLAKPFLALYESLGVPVERYLERHRLPPHGLQENHDVVPFLPLLRFIGGVAHAEGIPNAAQAATDYATRTELKWSHSGSSAPTLYSALTATAAKTKVETSTAFYLEEDAKSLFFCRQASFPEGPVEYHGGWLGISAVVEIVRCYLGKKWVPPRLAVPNTLTGQAWLQEVLPGTRVIPTTGPWWFEIPRSNTSAGPCHLNRSKTDITDKQFEPVRGSGLVPILGRIVRTYLPSGGLQVTEAAEILGMSRRSLQRQLFESNTTYRRILEEQRFELARTLLETTDQKIIDIAQLAGYESASNFSRAFRRMAGMTPREHRTNLDPLHRRP